MIILGLDPGSRTTGFGVIELSSKLSDRKIKHLGHGIISLPEKESLAKRLLVLSSCLQEVQLKYQPQRIVIEKIFLGKNADSAFKLGHARGVVMLEAQRQGVPIFEYATRLVKKGVAGRGSADKEEVRQVLKNLLGLSQIQYLDASDALALAVYHATVCWHELRQDNLKGIQI